MNRLVIGIDGGGTSTRARIAHLDGTLVASAKAGGVNPNSGSDPVKALTDVLEEVLAGLPGDERSKVAAGVAGLAGHLSSPARMTQAAQIAWQAVGLPGTPVVYSDLVVAYWSGLAGTESEAPDEGMILVAGTGAVGAVVNGTDITHLVDGNGYLLGDCGGGIWLGMQIARAALDSASGRGPATILEDLVFDGEDPQAWLGRFYGQPPRDIGALAMLLGRAYDAGDEIARQIARQAVVELSATVSAAAAKSSGTSIVVAGSIAAGSNPVGQGLREHLRGTGFTVTAGIDGLDGAIELASRSVRGIWPMS